MNFLNQPYRALTVRIGLPLKKGIREFANSIRKLLTGQSIKTYYSLKVMRLRYALQKTSFAKVTLSVPLMLTLGLADGIVITLTNYRD